MIEIIVVFLGLTFAISLLGFYCIVKIPAARSPETLQGLPFWLVMVWGPSLAAIAISFQQGQLEKLILRAVDLKVVPLEVWLLVAAPIAILFVIKPFARGEKTPISLGMICVMVLFNLLLGPLGEELGWRGLMQEQMNAQMGWLVASLIIGVIWFVWHLPLWTIDSPHAQISIHLFGIHCMLYSVIIGAAYTISNGSILPAILLHLTFNLASNGAVFAGYVEPDDWFRVSIKPYIVLSLLAVLIVYSRTGDFGLYFWA